MATFYEPFHVGVLERLLNEALVSQYGKAGRNNATSVINSFKPRLDLHEDAEKNLVTATFEFPGFSKDDVELNFHNDKLTVSAETKKSKEDANNGYTLRERLYGRFSRTLQLPQGVQDEHIKATMDNGLLTVTFPRNLPELTPKKIVISDL